MSKINYLDKYFYNGRQNIIHKIMSQSDQKQQKSEEWYELRKNNFGGSEISTLLELNPFSTSADLIKRKLGLSTFNGSIATRWGNIFEDVSSGFTEHVFSIDKIYVPGSLPGAIDNQRYSPDGLAVVKILCEENLGTYRWFLILFEFKSPYSSLPAGKVPNHYLPQVLTGMCSIKEVEMALFINCMFRICSKEQLAFNDKYNTHFHCKDKTKKFIPDNPHACGVICFYQSNSDAEEYLTTAHGSGPIPSFGESGVHEYDYRILGGSQGDPFDFGEEGYRILDRLFELVEIGRIKIKYPNMSVFTSELNRIAFLNSQNIGRKMDVKEIKKNISVQHDNINKFYNDNTITPIGIMPWKLMECDIIPVERNDKFIEVYRPEIERNLSILKKLRASSGSIKQNFNLHYGIKEPVTENEIMDIQQFSILG